MAVAPPISEVSLELQDVLNGGAAEAVQALVVVAHHAHVLGIARQQQHDLLLDEVRVLILVDDDVGDSLP